ncbi:glycosyltransferase [Paraclostridium bifermentans]
MKLLKLDLKSKQMKYIFNIFIAVLLGKFYLSTLMPNNFPTKYLLILGVAISMIIVLNTVLVSGVHNYLLDNKIYLVFSFIILCISVYTGNGEWLYTVIILMGLKEYDFEEFMKSYLYISIIYFILIISLNLLGIKPTNIFWDGTLKRYDLGFNNPNRAMFSVFTIWISYFYVKGKNLNLRDKLVLLILPILIYIPTRTRTAILTMIVISTLYMILNFVDIKNKKVAISLASIPIVISSISFILGTVLFNNNLLNNILSRRPEIWGIFLGNTEYPIKFLGYDNNIINIMAKGANLTLDNAYISLIFKNGIVMYCIIIGVYTAMIYYLSKKGDKVSVILVVSILIYSFGESMLVDISSNPSLMLIPIILKYIQDKIIKNKYYGGLHMKKNILFTIYSLESGGTEKILIDILNNLDRTKFNIELLLMRKGGSYLKNVPEDICVKYIFLGDDMIDQYHTILKKIYRLYRKIGTLTILKFPVIVNLYKGKVYDSEIAFEHGLSTVMMSKNLNKKSKKIFWVHTDLTKSLEYKSRSFLNQKLVNKASIEKSYKCADKIICVSENAKNSVTDLIKEIDTEKLIVIHNPIDKEKILEMSKEEVDYKKDCFTIIGCGRLVEEKRFDKLINIHKKLIDKGINNKLILIGDGPKRKELENMCENLNLQNSVVITGFTKNPYKYMKLGDVFVSCSDYEGYSLVVAEAIALNKIVVSTKTEGPKEILKDGLIGVLTDFDEDSILEGVCKVINGKYEIECIESNLKKHNDLFSLKSIECIENEIS